MFLCTKVLKFLLQDVAGKPKAKQAASTTKQDTSDLQQLAATVQAGINNATAILQGNLPDSKDVVKKLNDNAQTLANNVQDTVSKIKTEVSIKICETNAPNFTITDLIKYLFSAPRSPRRFR